MAMGSALICNILIAAIFSASSLLSAEPALSATSSASNYLDQGLRYRQQERYPEAIAALEKSLDLAPQNVSSRVVLGWTHHLAGQDAAAAEVLRQAIYRDFSDVPAFNAMGIVCLVSDNLSDAVAAHSWALILKPDNEIAYYNLSLAYHRLQKYDWAISTAIQAAKLEPTNPHPLVALAIAYWDSRKPALAQQAYRQALNLDPRYGDPAFLNSLFKAGFNLAQIQAAEQVLATVK